MSLKSEKRRLKFLATLNDETLPESTDPDYTFQYVDIGNVDAYGNIKNPDICVFKKAPSRARRIVRDGDVIVSTVRTYLQAIAPISESNDDLVVSTGFAVVRPNPDLLIPEFFSYAARESRFLADVIARSKGISYPAINSSELEDISISFLPKDKQKRIADYLDQETAKIDALIAEKERMLALLEEKRSTLISRAVTRGLNPEVPTKPYGLDWLGEIPAHWEVRRGKNIFRQSSLPVCGNDEIVTCFRNGEVTLRKNRREVGFTIAVLEQGYQGGKEGQLVIHSMDAFAGAIGVSDSDGKCSPEYIICEPVLKGVSSHYFGYLLRLMALRGYIQAACTAVRE